MTITPRFALAAAVLLSGVSFATAANVSKPAANSGTSVSQPADTLSLNASQRKIAWNDISSQAVKETTPANFNAKVGSAVPNNLGIHAVPASAANKVPALRPYSY